jgi:hypothetical protein
VLAKLTSDPSNDFGSVTARLAGAIKELPISHEKQTPMSISNNAIPAIIRHHRLGLVTTSKIRIVRRKQREELEIGITRATPCPL